MKAIFESEEWHIKPETDFEKEWVAKECGKICWHLDRKGERYVTPLHFAVVSDEDEGGFFLRFIRHGNGAES